MVETYGTVKHYLVYGNRIYSDSALRDGYVVFYSESKTKIGANLLRLSILTIKYVDIISEVTSSI